MKTGSNPAKFFKESHGPMRAVLPMMMMMMIFIPVHVF
jgi:hypothetical protein